MVSVTLPEHTLGTPEVRPITKVKARKGHFGAVLLWIAVFLLAYIVLIRSWHQHWGATSDEIDRTMPGDGLVDHPIEVTTRAITIRAEPRYIWPWLAQMGKGRGGLYSYDRLDIWAGVLEEPSSNEVLPEFQNLRAGDTIPVGGSPGWPVTLAEPNKMLLLDVHQDGAHVTWAFGLYPVSSIETRLVMRVRAQLLWSWKTPFIAAALDPAEFLMVRRQLIGIKQRAERLAREAAILGMPPALPEGAPSWPQGT